jgi:hypothetical protein
MTMYHWDTEQEDFLVLPGEAIAIVEGEERPLRQWDLLPCPAGTSHAIVGAGEGLCVIFAVGARGNHTYRTADGSIDGRDNRGAYTVDEAALRHRTGVEEETTDADTAYASSWRRCAACAQTRPSASSWRSGSVSSCPIGRTDWHAFAHRYETTCRWSRRRSSCR